MSEESGMKKNSNSFFRDRRLLAVVLSLVAFAYIVSGCAQNLFYYPDKDDHGGSPAASGLKHESVEFSSADGTRLTD